MADTQAAGGMPRGKSRIPLLAVGALALVLAGGGFYAVKSGMVLGHREADAAHDMSDPVAAPADVTFVALDPLLVSISRSDPVRQLRFEGHLEVAPANATEVQRLMPRIMDVMNSYLRAVELQDLRDPAALLRLRAQLLRRIQVVTGEGRVNDLLVSTFLVS